MRPARHPPTCSNRDAILLIGLVVVLTLSFVLAPLTADAQESGKIYRVGRLSVSVAEPASSEAFRRGLRELGWVVDQNVVVEQHNAGGDLKRLAAVAAELVRKNVDVIVAAGSDAVEAAFRATKSIPIVMAVGSDPERRGWIKSLARPGGNVTGLTRRSRPSSLSGPMRCSSPAMDFSLTGARNLLPSRHATLCPRASICASSSRPAA